MMMLTSVSSAAAVQTAQKGQQNKAPAAAQDTSAQAAPAPSATSAAPATADAQANAQPFARWLGQQDGAAAQALQASLPTVADTSATAATDAAATPAAAATADGQPADDGKTAAAIAPDSSLLAAMAMPLMPLSPQQVTQAVQAAQGGARAGATDAGTAEAQPQAVSGQDSRRPAVALPQAALMAAQPAAAQPAAQAAQAEATAANVHQAVQAGAGSGSPAGTGSQDAGADGQSVQAGPNPAAAAPLMGAAAPAPAQPAADTVKLAGPPTAWRQTLQETLGDKLHVQVGNNVQQATISIEPPQLGRIDIAIRHSAGTLEVNISATHGEVLRQLQTVGDNLRNDLSQRQYTEVAVTVTPTPKNGAAPFGDPQQQQGRGRQQGRDQDNEPGRGLAEAGNPASVFKLGRDS